MWKEYEEDQSNFLKINQARLVCTHEKDDLLLIDIHENDIHPWADMPDGVALPPIHQSITETYFEIKINYNLETSNLFQEFNTTNQPDVVIGIKSECSSFKYTSSGVQILYDEEKKRILFSSKYICNDNEQNMQKKIIVGFHVYRVAMIDGTQNVVQMTRMGRRYLKPRAFQGNILNPIVLLNYSKHSINSIVGTDVDVNIGNKTFYYTPGKRILYDILKTKLYFQSLKKATIDDNFYLY